MRLSMLHLGLSRSRMPEEGPFIEELRRIGELTIRKDGDSLSDEERAELIRDCDVLLTMWGSAPVPVEIAANPGRLRYICNITGEMTKWVPLAIIESDIPVTNWGDAPADAIAEAAMALLLASVKEILPQVRHIERGGWRLEGRPRGQIKGLRVGVYGLGAIGRRFLELIRPFGPELAVYDPFVPNMPTDCMRVDSLEQLFDHSDAVVVHAGLTETTRRSIDAGLLARLPDYGIVINTARGEIIDEEALFAELASGRLRAALDVVAEGDQLDPSHPARYWDSCILTAHSLAKITWNLPRLLKREEICLDNLRRHLEGKPLRYAMDKERYLRST